MRVAATAVMSAGGGLEGAWRQNPATLDLIDPFQRPSVAVADNKSSWRPIGRRRWPCRSRGHLSALEWTGLFDSNFEQPGTDAGLYMLRPYEPGKIPVMFVHGLVSSPRAWVQTINELQNTPGLASRYQFWMFIYPTGMPIPGSAARLREAIAKARYSLDPGRADPAFGQMVLVGHSMGGLLSKMMAQDSRLDALGRRDHGAARSVQGVATELRIVAGQRLDIPPIAVREPGRSSSPRRIEAARSPTAGLARPWPRWFADPPRWTHASPRSRP